MIELKDGGKYVRRDGVVVTVAKSDHPVWQFSVNGNNAYRKDGTYHTCVGVISDGDIIAEYPKAFTISAGNYYRTRDGRKAYVACGPVDVDCQFFSRYMLYFGFVKIDGTDSHENSWDENGRMDRNQPGHADDLVAPWHPETLTDPTTGKKYRVAEEVT